MQEEAKLRKSPSLLPIFRSRSLALVLAYLFNRSSEEPLNISQLARRLDLAVSTVTRDIAELERVGILRTESFGNAKIVRLDDSSPYHEELASLLLKAFGPRQILSELLGGIEGIREAYLYGSWAARYLGEPGPQPEDIDLLVISDEGLDIRQINRVSREASELLDREVNPVVVTGKEWREARSGFLRTIRQRPLLPLDLTDEL